MISRKKSRKIVCKEYKAKVCEPEGKKVVCRDKRIEVCVRK